MPAAITGISRSARPIGNSWPSRIKRSHACVSSGGGISAMFMPAQKASPLPVRINTRLPRSRLISRQAWPSVSCTLPSRAPHRSGPPPVCRVISNTPSLSRSNRMLGQSPA